VKQATIVITYEGAANHDDILAWLKDIVEKQQLGTGVDIVGVHPGWPSTVILVDDQGERG
jgi:hypothetical protein